MQGHGIYRFLSGACFAVLISIGAPAAAAQETIVLTTTEWPPYSGSELREKGAAADVASRALAKSGAKIAVEVMPWKRAISTAKKGVSAIGYFPGYHCRHVAGFVASDPIGFGPLGFAEMANKPIQWTTLSDVAEQGLRIGTVRGYANTEEFDQRVGAGWIRAIAAQTDTANLLALARGRVDAAVIDQRVMQFLLKTEPELKKVADKIRFDEVALEVKRLYACFVDTEAGRKARDLLNAGLAQLSADLILADYIRTLE